MVGRSVCLLVTFMSPVKRAEPIEMPFGGLTQVSPGKHVLGASQGRTNSFAVSRGDKTAMRPLSKFFDHLLGRLLQVDLIKWVSNVRPPSVHKKFLRFQ